MGGYSAIIVFLTILFVSGFVSLMISPFINTDVPNSNSLLSPFISLLADGFDIDLPLLDSFNVDFLFFLPDSINTYIDSQLYSFTYFPDFISVPLVILMVFSLVFAVASFIPTIAGG